MPEEDILAEVRRVREEMARECNFDIALMFERFRKAEAKLKAEGWTFADFSQPRAREEPATYGKAAEAALES